MSKSTVTPVGRASFPKLGAVDQYGNYGVALLLLKTDPKVIEFVVWLKQAVNEEALAVAGAAGLPAAMAEFGAFKDGDNVALFKTYRNEYAGHWILNTRRKADFGKPCCVNRNKQPIEPSEIYPGCDILAYIDVYGYKFGTKKSVSIGIQHVMKVGENTPFASAGVDVDDAFSQLEIPVEGVTGAVATPTGGAPIIPVTPGVLVTPVPVTPVPVTPITPAIDPFAGV